MGRRPLKLTADCRACPLCEDLDPEEKFPGWAGRFFCNKYNRVICKVDARWHIYNQFNRHLKSSKLYPVHCAQVSGRNAKPWHECSLQEHGLRLTELRYIPPVKGSTRGGQVGGGMRGMATVRRTASPRSPSRGDSPQKDPGAFEDLSRGPSKDPQKIPGTPVGVFLTILEVDLAYCVAHGILQRKTS